LKPTSVVDTSTTAREVLGYFLSHPDATDDLEVLARWRIRLRAAEDTFEAVAGALGWLVERGYLLQEPTGDPKGRYRLNASRAEEAERFVSGKVRPGDLFSRIRAWLDAVMLRYRWEHPPVGGDLPGLARGPGSVEFVIASDASALASDDEAVRAEEEALSLLIDALENEGATDPLSTLYAELGLTVLEVQVVLLCLAPELDPRYQTVLGVLNDDLTRRAVTLGLACALLGDPIGVRDALARSRGLTTWRLLEHGSLPYADEPLRLDAPLVAWLLGDERALLSDPRLSQVIRSEPWPGGAWVEDADGGEVRTLVQALRRTGAPADAWVALTGVDVDGWRAWVEAQGHSPGRPWFRLQLPAAASDERFAGDEVGVLAARAARLSRAVPVVDASGADTSLQQLAKLLGTLERVSCRGLLVAHDVQRVFSTLPSAPCAFFHRAVGAQRTAAAFEGAARDAGLALTTAQAERLAHTFPIPLQAILDAARIAALSGAGAAPPDEQFAMLLAACRNVAAPELPQFARCVDTPFRLKDVILPGERREQLEEVVAHVLHAGRVMNTWGFSTTLPYGRGIAALFFGPSGTGKTMAAQAIARELGTQTYVVDLSRVVSKYIGESEKHLDAAFRDAERAGAVLLFDEADALFGKRSEIKDAHDRYANIEIAYLLQRIESFGGLAILTTNFRQNVDQAFLRRLRFVVEFPKPDALAREAIWRQCLPKAAPVAPDVDLRSLSRRLELTGGNIRQVTLHAAFTAAHEGAEAITMRHLLSATRAELRKLGMPIAERELSAFDQPAIRVA
jgi:hypothetical protein